MPGQEDRDTDRIRIHFLAGISPRVEGLRVKEGLRASVCFDRRWFGSSLVV